MQMFAPLFLRFVFAICLLAPKGKHRQQTITKKKFVFAKHLKHIPRVFSPLALPFLYIFFGDAQ